MARFAGLLSDVEEPVGGRFAGMLDKPKLGRVPQPRIVEADTLAAPEVEATTTGRFADLLAPPAEPDVPRRTPEPTLAAPSAANPAVPRPRVPSPRIPKSNIARGFKGGVQETIGLWHGFSGMAKSLLGDKPGAGESFEKYQSRMEKAAEYELDVPTFFDHKDGKQSVIGGDGSATERVGKWASGTMGKLAPMMAEFALSGLAGAAIGSQVVPGVGPDDAAAVPVGFLAGIGGRTALKKLAQETAETILKKNIKGMTKKAAAELAEKSVKKHVARAIGSRVAVTAFGAAVESGGMWAEGIERGFDNPWSALGLGLVSGATESTMGVGGQLQKLIASKSLASVFKSKGARKAAGILWDALKSAGEEGGQEALQELIGGINNELNDPNFQITDKENFMQWAEAGAAGALMGLTTGAGGSSASTIIEGVQRRKRNAAIMEYRAQIEAAQAEAEETAATVGPEFNLETYMDQQADQAARAVAEQYGVDPVQAEVEAEGDPQLDMIDDMVRNQGMTIEEALDASEAIRMDEERQVRLQAEAAQQEAATAEELREMQIEAAQEGAGVVLPNLDPEVAAQAKADRDAGAILTEATAAEDAAAIDLIAETGTTEGIIEPEVEIPEAPAEVAEVQEAEPDPVQQILETPGLSMVQVRDQAEEAGLPFEEVWPQYQNAQNISTVAQQQEARDMGIETPSGSLDELQEQVRARQEEIDTQRRETEAKAAKRKQKARAKRLEKKEEAPQTLRQRIMDEYGGIKQGPDTPSAYFGMHRKGSVSAYDQIAQDLYDQGVLPDAHPNTLTKALDDERIASRNKPQPSEDDFYEDQAARAEAEEQDRQTANLEAIRADEDVIDIDEETLTDDAIVRKNGQWFKVSDQPFGTTLEDGVDIEVVGSIKAAGVLFPGEQGYDEASAEYDAQEREEAADALPEREAAKPAEVEESPDREEVGEEVRPRDIEAEAETLSLYRAGQEGEVTGQSTSQRSGYYPGLYFARTREHAATFGKNVRKESVTGRFYEVEDADALKTEANAAGFETRNASGTGEVEYLKSLGYDGMTRGTEEVIVFAKVPTKAKPRVPAPRKLKASKRDMDEFHAEIEARKAEKQKAVDDTLKTWPEAGRQAHLIKGEDEGRFMGAAIFPSTRNKGKWQLSYYDSKGFSGHTDHDTYTKAVEDAISQNYQVTKDKRLSTISATKEFQDGVERLGVAQYWNSLVSSGKRAQADELNDVFEKEGLDAAVVKMNEMKSKKPRVPAPRKPKAYEMTKEDYAKAYPTIPKGILDRIRSISHGAGENILNADGAIITGESAKTIMHEIGHLAEYELTESQYDEFVSLLKEEAPTGIHGLRTGKHINDPYYIIEDLSTAFAEFHLQSDVMDKFPKLKQFIGKYLSKEMKAPAGELFESEPTTRTPVRGETKKPQVPQEELLGGLSEAKRAGEAERAQEKLELEEKSAPKKARVPKPRKAKAKTEKVQNPTPMMRQYDRIKAALPDPENTILAFRLGDFYEFFGKDADAVSAALGIPKTKRSGISMVGIPYHQIDSQIQKLVDAGNVVAKAEQTEKGSTPTAKTITIGASKKSAEKPAAKKEIEDFGEKIGGARKDMVQSIQREISDEDIASMPLSKIWPKSDVDKIEDVKMASLAHAVRSEIPNKPRTRYKVSRWVEQVKLVQGIMRHAQDLGRDSIMERLKANSALVQFANKIELLDQVPREQWDRIGKVEHYPDAYSYQKNEQGESVKVPSPHANAWVDGRIVRASDLSDLATAVKERIAGEKLSPTMKFEVRMERRTKNVFINKKGDSLYRPLKTFTGDDAVKQARAFISGSHNELVQAWEEVKKRDNVKERDVRRDVNKPRTGKDHRQGKDATPEMFQDAFAFRGVEFGKWVSQGKNSQERQGMLNDAYDALMDLADIVGVSPKAMSLNGTLGLGLGSRGSGWASAHFEPDFLAINLTKTRGAGSLAHEWFHALDNYFMRKRGEPKGGDRDDYFITHRPETRYVSQKTGYNLSEERYNRIKKQGGIRDAADWKKVKGVRPEVEEAFTDLVKALDDSPMRKRSKLIDKGKSNGYWGRTLERAARAFENYVIAKMQNAGYDNDYLANVVSVEEFGRDISRYPYLMADELAPVAEAFDNLFATIETRETERGIEMFMLEDSDIQGYAIREGIPQEKANEFARQVREFTNPQQLTIPLDVQEQPTTPTPRKARVPRPKIAKTQAAPSPYQSLKLTKRQINAIKKRTDKERAAWYEGKWQEAFAEVGEDRAVMNIIPELLASKTPMAIDIAGMKISSPQEVHALMSPLRSPYFETMKVLWLDRRGHGIRSDIVSVGVLDASLVHPAAILRSMPKEASSYIVSHNHPSGDPQPSAEDIMVTKKVARALTRAGLTLSDHVITNGKTFVSMRENGLIDFTQYKGTRSPKPNYKIKERDVPDAVDVYDWEIRPGVENERPWSPEIVKRLAQSFGDNSDQIHILYLNTQNNVIGVQQVPNSITTLQAISTMSRNAADAGAAAMVVHVPGDGTPSAERIRWTRALTDAMSIQDMDILLLDVILSQETHGSGHYSLRENGIVQFARETPAPYGSGQFMLDKEADEGVQRRRDERKETEADRRRRALPDTDAGRELVYRNARRERKFAAISRRFTGPSASEFEKAIWKDAQIDEDALTSQEWQALDVKTTAMGYTLIPVKNLPKISGFTDPDTKTILVNTQSSHPAVQIHGHESFHVLRRLENVLAEYIQGSIDTSSRAFLDYKAKLFSIPGVKDRFTSLAISETRKAPSPARFSATRLQQQINDAIDQLVAEEMAANIYAGVETHFGVTQAEAISADEASKIPAAIDAINDGLTAEALGDTGRRGPPRFMAAAYHGTPHVWAPEPGYPHGRPKLDKIGTGEGAAAFGWGWYSAEAEGVARTYADLMPGGDATLEDGTTIPRWIAEQVQMGGAADIRADFAQRMAESQAKINAQAPQWWLEQGHIATHRAVLNAVDKMEGGLGLRESSLYTLDIPDSVIPQLLDWDAPLSEQPKSVQKALRPIIAAAAKSFPNLPTANPTGQGIYEAYVSHRGGDKKAASEAFAEAGIPGNKYLDQGSRPSITTKRTLGEFDSQQKAEDAANAFDGGTWRKQGDKWFAFAPAIDRTRNFVIWDQDVLNRIALLERNGEKLDAIREAQYMLEDQTALDREYMAAVEAGDTAKQQEMVDQAAKAAGYTYGPFWHGSDASSRWDVPDVPLFLSEHKDVAENIFSNRRDGSVYKFYVQPRNMEQFTKGQTLARYMKKENIDDLRQRGIDSVFLSESRVGAPVRRIGSEMLVMDPSQVKSADPVTYDDAGNVIPLSERFQPESPDIRFMLEDNIDSMSRKDLQEEAKRIGMMATGKNDEMREMARIARRRPSTWSMEDFDKILPYLRMHQMFREDVTEGMMKEGMKRGMVDPLDNFARGTDWSWAKVIDKPTAIFLSGTLEWQGETGRIKGSEAPIAVIRPDGVIKRGEKQKILDALHEAGRRDVRFMLEDLEESTKGKTKAERVKAVSSFFDAAAEDIARRKRMERPAERYRRVPESEILEERQRGERRIERAVGIAQVIERAQAKAKAEQVKTKTQERTAKARKKASAKASERVAKAKTKERARGKARLDKQRAALQAKIDANKATIKELKESWRIDKKTLKQRSKEFRAYVRNSLPSSVNKVSRDRIDTILSDALTTADDAKAELKFTDAVREVDTIAKKAEHKALLKEASKMVTEEYQRLKKYRGKTKARRTLEANRGMQEYLDNLTKTTEVNQKEIDDAMAWFEQHPEEEVPDDLKKKIAKLSRPTLEDMDNIQLSKVIGDLKTMRKEGFLKWKAEQQRWRQQNEARGESIAKSIYETSKERYPQSSLEKALDNQGRKGKLHRTGDVGKKYWWGHWRPEHILEWFDGYKGNVHRTIFNPIRDAEQTEQVNKDRDAKVMDQMFEGLHAGKAMGKTVVATMETVSDVSDLAEAAGIPVKGKTVKFNLDNLMFIYAHSQNEHSRAHLRGSGISNEEIDRLSNELRTKFPEYASAVDEYIDWMDDEWFQRMNDVFSEEHGVDMAKETRYFPIDQLDTMMAENATLSDMIARLSTRPASVSKGMTISRIKSKAPFKRLSFFQTAVGHVMKNEHYVAYNKAIRDVNAVLNQKDAKQAMQYRSEEAYNQLKDWLKAVALGRIESAPGAINKVSDILRTNFVTSALGFNFVTMLKQPASFMQGARNINTATLTATAAEFSMHPLRMIKQVQDMSVQMSHRAASVEREISEIMSKGEVSHILGTEKNMQKLREAAMMPIQKADQVTTTILWMAKYREQLQKTGNEAQAAEAADKLIRTTQPQGGLNHLPQVHRAGGIARAYTMFTNQLNQNWNLSMRMMGEKTSAGSKVADAAMYWVLPSLLIYLASTGVSALPTGDEEERERFWKGWARAFASNIFGGLAIANRLIDAGMVAATGDTTGARFLTDLSPTSFQGVKDIIEGIAMKKPQSLIEGMLQTTGIPYLQPKRTIKGTQNFMETGDPRYLIWSPYALGGEPEPKAPTPSRVPSPRRQPTTRRVPPRRPVRRPPPRSRRPAPRPTPRR